MYKVLVADDENLVRRGIVMETGWQKLDCMVVAEAANGEEALEAVHRYRPDFIICDIRMPKMDGLELLQILRGEGNEVPFVFLTAYSDFSYAQQALKLGAFDYLLKPFEDKELIEVIRRIKDRLEKRQEKLPKREILDQEAIQKGSKSKYVTEAVQYIAQHCVDQNLTVNQIAASLGLSEGHLSHTFKKETGYTVNAYITRFRIQKAMELLKDCRYKVYEVGEMVGYRDMTYFSTLFKKVVGVNPSVYQDNCKETEIQNIAEKQKK